MLSVGIKLVGPGLLVNGPGMVVRQALIDAGYSVACDDWPGLDQAQEAGITAAQVIANKERNADIQIDMQVTACPWGG